ncbi:MAG: zinc metallopeptidase [Firmicutes bacterium]|jgi:Zn-dependent membrane protease YugP|nr:zinc metallopeptidase [Bacillota bacterium]
MWFFDTGMIIFVIPAMIFAMYAQSKVRSAYGRYSRVHSSSSMTGAQVARTLLNQAGLEEVKVVQTQGQLTDHYDPRQKVVRLSPQVYGDSSLAALGIAAHEVGHAIQHDTDYLPLGIRNSIVPLASLGSRAAFPLFFIGFIFSGSGLEILMDIGIAVFLFAVLFQAITLPVEFNASNRAIAILEGGGYLNSQELNGAKQVLSAAALTYVAALAVAFAQLFRLLLLRDRR